MTRWWKHEFGALALSPRGRQGRAQNRSKIIMPTPIDERIAVSTWSLHRLMGTTYPHDLASNEIGHPTESYGPVEESLLDLPAVLHNHGYSRMELASFHLPSRDPAYVEELRAQLISN